jgi:hypothetical protein
MIATLPGAGSFFYDNLEGVTNPSYFTGWIAGFTEFQVLAAHSLLSNGFGYYSFT